jgi:hypothetical protein
MQIAAAKSNVSGVHLTPFRFIAFSEVEIE